MSFKVLYKTSELAIPLPSSSSPNYPRNFWMSSPPSPLFRPQPLHPLPSLSLPTSPELVSPQPAFRTPPPRNPRITATASPLVSAPAASALHLPVSGGLGALFGLCLQGPGLRERKPRRGARVWVWVRVRGGALSCNSGFSFGVGTEVAEGCIASLNCASCPRLSENLLLNCWVQDRGKEKQ